jgi:hypothetical protein
MPSVWTLYVQMSLFSSLVSEWALTYKGVNTHITLCFGQRGTLVCLYLYYYVTGNQELVLSFAFVAEYQGNAP